MKVSTKGRYALRMMIDLGLIDNEGFISLGDMAKRQELSTKYMEQIVSLLTKCGLLQSVRGPQGGYKLARKTNEYTVGEILRATEGCLAPVACISVPQNTCPRADICTTLAFWEGFYDIIEEYVNSITLFDLIEHEKKRKVLATEVT